MSEIILTITGDQLADILAKASRPKRLDELLAKYGETCTITDAQRIVGCGYTLISEALEDGRISPACCGKRVDIRSLVEYIENRGEADRRAKINRLRDSGVYRV